MKELNTGKAIASMVLGIVSVSFSVFAAIILFFLFVPAMIIATSALTCGILAIVLAGKAKGLGRAIAGLVLGIVGTSLTGCIMIIGIVIFFFF